MKYPIYHGPRLTAGKLMYLLRAQPTIWTKDPEAAFALPGFRPKGAAQLWLIDSSAADCVAQVFDPETINSRFPLLALHTPGVWLRQLAEILEVPVPPGKKHPHLQLGRQPARRPEITVTVTVR